MEGVNESVILAECFRAMRPHPEDIINVPKVDARLIPWGGQDEGLYCMHKSDGEGRGYPAPHGDALGLSVKVITKSDIIVFKAVLKEKL